MASLIFVKRSPTRQTVLLVAFEAGEVSQSSPFPFYFLIFFIVSEGKVASRRGTPMESFEGRHSLIQGESLILEERVAGQDFV